MKELSQIDKVRHSLSHIMTMAVLELYPNAGLGVGPVIEHGFYQDYDLPEPLSEEMLPKIEARMKEIIKEKIAFVQSNSSIEEALAFYTNDPYKTELIHDLQKEGETEISFYDSGAFHNMCEGPHVENSSMIRYDAFTLMSVAGAYWRGDEKNKMLTRIYGVAFEDKKALKAFLALLEEAKKRDHRKIGKEQELYFIDDTVGKGLIMWLPNGTIIREQIEQFAKQKEEEGGYVRVVTPHIAKEDLFLRSGHLPYYKEDMYPAMEMDDGVYYLKAMNCPHHHQIFLHGPKSYKDMPMRIAEYGMCYRNELSGTLAGLLRVRGLAMNDAHLYCRKDQVKEEFKQVLLMVKEYFNIFGFAEYWLRLSKWSPEHKDKYIDQPENWAYTEGVLRELLTELGMPFVEAEDEAAFYGPKVDVQFRSVLGREETMSTVQLDFLAKERFGLSYIDEQGEKNGDVFVIHRAPLSVHERFLAFLIEHYAGYWPVWLSPVQVAILPVSTEKHLEGAMALAKEMKDQGIRVSVNSADETVGKKIREAAQAKIPYVLVVGDKELSGEDFTLRVRRQEEQQTISKVDFFARVAEDIASKKVW